MNMMFLINGTIVTAPLDGSILPGVTRDSILTLARSEGYKVEERKIHIDELMDACESGALTEAWGTGTAAVVSPVGHLAYKDKMLAVGDAGIGKLTQHFYDRLTGIQWGRLDDPFGWVTEVK